MSEPLLRADGLVKSFITRRSVVGAPTEQVHAVRSASIDVYPGKTIGLVGESGSGKSTLARLIHRQYDADAGTIVFDGEDVTHAKGAALKAYRRNASFVFQDPYASLNPAWTIRRIVGEPLRIHTRASGRKITEQVELRLNEVGLDPAIMDRRPAQFSGGQRQRIAIARALTTSPRLLICDEPVSALDVSTRAQVLTILTDLQRDLGLGVLMITHDLSVVQAVAEQVAVMYLGEIVERGPSDQVAQRPLHPYTVALLSASPEVHATATRPRIVLSGETPSPTTVAPGCAFAGRCPRTMKHCWTERPPVVSFEGQLVACHLHAQGMPGAGVTPAMPALQDEAAA